MVYSVLQRKWIAIFVVKLVEYVLDNRTSVVFISHSGFITFPPDFVDLLFLCEIFPFSFKKVLKIFVLNSDCFVEQVFIVDVGGS